MLPFPKRKATSEEVELTDDDLVLVEEFASPARVRSAAPQPSPSAAASQSGVRASLSRPPRGAALPPGSRRVLDEQIEEDVADQCLASIAAATSVESSRHGSSSSHIRAALAAAPLPTISPSGAPLASFAASSQASSHGAIRLPSVTAPPFVRASTYPFASDRDLRALHGAPEAPGIRDSSPPAAFIRRSTPALAYRVSSASLPASAPSSVVAANASAFGSVAPVSMTSLPQAGHEPTVIVVRERPRSVWILAAAAFGAACAIAAMRLGPVNGEAGVVMDPRAAVLAPAPAPLPPTAVVAPGVVSAPSAAPVLASASASTVVAPPRSTAPASGVMNFADDQGAAIRLPSPLAPPSPPSPRKAAGAPPGVPAPPAARPAPRVPSMGPALPDGSCGLGRSDTTTAAAPPSLTAPPPAPEPPRKRVLTPEQQLAEAQLKASMK